MLSWSPTENNGGSEVTHYIVEKREIDRKTWATVKAEVQLDKIPFKVSGLMPGTEYYFRVTAVNEYGSGVPKVTPTSYLASDPVSKYRFLITCHITPKTFKMFLVFLSEHRDASSHYSDFFFKASQILVRGSKFWR